MAEPQVLARARLLRIEDTRRDEPAFVDSLMRGGDARLRADAVLSAGRLGARLHLPLMRELVADADTAVAANALFALSLVKDTLSRERAVGALRRPVAVAIQGAWLLGELGEAARPALLSALADTTLAAPVRAALLQASARLRPVPASAVIPLVASPDSSLAWRAAYVLSRGRSAAGVRALIAASRSPWSAVREQSARALSRSLAGDSLGADARTALDRLVGDAEPRVRANAARALASYGRGTTPALQRLLRDPDANVRLSAAQSLEPVFGEDAAAWRAAWDADTSLVMRAAVMEGAAKHGLLGAELAPWGDSPEWRRRAGAASMERYGSAASALARTRHHLDDPDGRVRIAAVDALSSYVDSAGVREAVRDALRGLLRDPDVGVRGTALGALASHASMADLATALESYEIARRDADPDARLAFWTLADSVLRHAPAAQADSAGRRLSALGVPADAIERGAAARLGLFAAWRDSLGGTPRSAAWYELRAREALGGARPVLHVDTERGAMELELFMADAPLTVNNVVTLARRGYFNGLRFHRVVPNFVVQGGDPRGDGSGGPGYAIRDELNRRRYGRGTLGMALSGPHTGGSQFFITHSPQPHLDGGYTVFGQLLGGGEVLDRIVQGDRIVRITVR